ncbi:MAG TPA: glycosyltransferase, partial [Candidatus Binatia bacterium]|nr:glycosyltransferase [Candidatus Binatia bacterium]
LACLRREYRDIEATIAAKATALITISPALSSYFERSYGLKNVFTIPNGYDEQDLAVAPGKNDFAAGVLHVVHAGKIGLSDSTRSLRPFIAAVEHLRQADGELGLKLQLHFVGELSAKEKRGLQGLKNAGIAHLYGARDHSFSLAVQQKADLFLLITSSVRPGIAPGKLFEYLAQRKPILALDDGTHAGEIVRATDSGWIVPAHDVETIAATLEKIVNDKEFRAMPSGSAAAIGRYAAARQMEQLNGILQQVRSAHGNRP